MPYLEGLPDSTSDLQSRQVLAVGIPLPESPKEKRKKSRLFVPSEDEDEDERAIDLSRKESPKERTFNVSGLLKVLFYSAVQIIATVLSSGDSNCSLTLMYQMKRSQEQGKRRD